MSTTWWKKQYVCNLAIENISNSLVRRGTLKTGNIDQSLPIPPIAAPPLRLCARRKDEWCHLPSHTRCMPSHNWLYGFVWHGQCPVMSDQPRQDLGFQRQVDPPYHSAISVERISPPLKDHTYSMQWRPNTKHPRMGPWCNWLVMSTSLTSSVWAHGRPNCQPQWVNTPCSNLLQTWSTCLKLSR